MRQLLRQGSASESGRRAEPGGDDDSGRRRSARPLKPPQRRAPSLVRELIQALLLQPEPARSDAGCPQPGGRHARRQCVGCAGRGIWLIVNTHSLPVVSCSISSTRRTTRYSPPPSTGGARSDNENYRRARGGAPEPQGLARYWQQAHSAGASPAVRTASVDVRRGDRAAAATGVRAQGVSGGEPGSHRTTLVTALLSRQGAKKRLSAMGRLTRWYNLRFSRSPPLAGGIRYRFSRMTMAKKPAKPVRKSPAKPKSHPRRGRLPGAKARGHATRKAAAKKVGKPLRLRAAPGRTLFPQARRQGEVRESRSKKKVISSSGDPAQGR